jgi:hypothetical protein
MVSSMTASVSGGTSSCQPLPDGTGVNCTETGKEPGFTRGVVAGNGSDVCEKPGKPASNKPKAINPESRFTVFIFLIHRFVILFTGRYFINRFVILLPAGYFIHRLVILFTGWLFYSPAGYSIHRLVILSTHLLFYPPAGYFIYWSLFYQPVCYFITRWLFYYPLVILFTRWLFYPPVFYFIYRFAILSAGLLRDVTDIRC